jgi:hypothetical protein
VFKGGGSIDASYRKIFSTNVKNVRNDEKILFSRKNRKKILGVFLAIFCVFWPFNSTDFDSKTYSGWFSYETFEFEKMRDVVASFYSKILQGNIIFTKS